ncbi:uncharacterized protein BYT42DRAFT_560540 [Radiomyces spectabilis]|uniref:uncharacterized protein n=1 Tax=Radiomyces spectabilis TaxID=64574 RepID=UPI00222115AF|nr:uncharacterized protein BYT42DRAFT_560540 [Radiomyces spectabilis]KAI8388569.1 hypothetical protein BYT42DRAFT_560540 [Radiomyces spectabilis]
MPPNDISMYISQPDSVELLAQIIALLSVSVMSTLFGIKFLQMPLKQLSYSRWLIFILFVLSWAFTTMSFILMHTHNGNALACLLSEIACDLFYTSTKIVVYLWLVERVWVVSSARCDRWQSKSYRFHILLLTPYVIIFTLMFIYHIALIADDGICYIGLHIYASIPLLIYDLFFNAYMTILFIKPLMRTTKSVGNALKYSRVRDVTRKTFIASIVSLLVSFANIFALTVMGGQTRGAICLTTCNIDVMINVIVIHWVTTNPSKKKAHGRHEKLDSISNEALTNSAALRETIDVKPPLSPPKTVGAKAHAKQTSDDGF